MIPSVQKFASADAVWNRRIPMTPINIALIISYHCVLSFCITQELLVCSHQRKPFAIKRCAKIWLFVWMKTCLTQALFTEVVQESISPIRCRRCPSVVQLFVLAKQHSLKGCVASRRVLQGLFACFHERKPTACASFVCMTFGTAVPAFC